MFYLVADPFSMAPQKALESIGKTLSVQYERWQPRVKTIMPRTLYDLLYFWSISLLDDVCVGSL